MVIVYFIATPPLTERLKLETALFIPFCVTRTCLGHAQRRCLINAAWLTSWQAGWLAGWMGRA